MKHKAKITKVEEINVSQKKHGPNLYFFLLKTENKKQNTDADILNQLKDLINGEN